MRFLMKGGLICKRPVFFKLWQNVAFVLVGVWPLATGANEGPEDSSVLPLTSSREMAKEKHNPFADQITIPVELSSGLDVGPGNGTTGGLNVQPAIPLSLGENWKIIARPSLSILSSEQPNRKLGFGDIELQAYLTPGFSDKWVWGIGPDLQLPTATDHTLGTGKWSAGPAIGLLYLNGPWANGILANHVWSFAGASGRADVSQSTFEPVLSYNFENGLFIGSDSTITADWNAAADKRWTIPLGMDVGKVFSIGNKSLSLQFGTYYNVLRAEGTARWLVRFQVSLIIPKHAASPQPATAE